MAETQAPLNPTSNALGLAGFITSILGIVSCGLLSPIGVLLSLIALFKRPRGFAIAGVIIGLIGSLWILVILVIFGVVVLAVGAAALAAGPGGFEMFGDSMVIESKLDEYRRQNASLPASLAQVSGLDAEVLKDHWGHEYIYTPDLVNNTFTIRSMGADGADGTADDMTYTGESFYTGPKQP
ncbi:MAG: type II secretion system protein GspG [Phycisphaerales bacterium]